MTDIALLDMEPVTDDLKRDALEGLMSERKMLPSKYLYDQRGSELFEDICDLPEYYITRADIEILRTHSKAIADVIGPNVELIEYGSGASVKTRLLLEALHHPTAYVPVEISREHLLEASRSIARDFPRLEVLPICVDYMQTFEIPKPSEPTDRRVVYFPGSTIGNFADEDARTFLDNIAGMLGPDDGLLLGADRRKDPAIHIPAYNDQQGVTADFNLNLLQRLNRELDTDFDLEQFEHEAIWNEKASRIEMHLISQTHQSVQLADESIQFDEGETILTEYSHKYSPEHLKRITHSFKIQHEWNDEKELFSLFYLTVT